jgi:hypothetical protein
MSKSQDLPTLQADLREDYNAALNANVAARKKYQVAVAQRSPSAAHAVDAQEPPDLLALRLELLREQKRHATLAGLSDALEAIRYSHGKGTVANAPLVTEATSNVTNPKLDIPSLTGSLGQSMQRLELAVVQAHHQARREKALLKQAKISAPDPNVATPLAHVFALSAVRDELTKWLEDSLDRCQEGDGPPPEIDADAEPKKSDWDTMIDAEYERYLDGRRRLIAAVGELRAPLPPDGEEARDDHTKTSEHPEDSSTRTEAIDGLVAAIEARLLPYVQQKDLVHAHLSAAEKKMQKEIGMTAAMLDRLSDESQLLQAFPFLGHSERFQHATFAFGRKRDHNMEADAKDPIDERIAPWLFAADAAEIAYAGPAKKQIQLGNEALEKVLQNLDELRFLTASG